MAKAFCLKCKKDVELGEGKFEVVTWKNGVRAIKGTCPDCGRNIYNILKKDAQV